MKPSDILGRWSLVSYTKQCDGKIIGHPLGEKARGLLLYTPDGGIGAYLQDEMKPPLIAYAGSWTMDGDTITHAVTFNMDSDRVGTTLVRKAQFDGARLILETPRKKTAQGTVWLQLVWRRGA